MSPLLDSWEICIPHRGDLAQKLKSELLIKINQRNIPNLRIREGTKTQNPSPNDPLFRLGAPYDYLLFDLVADEYPTSRLTLKIEVLNNNDLVLSWELYQQSSSNQLGTQMTQWGLVILGACITLAGFFTIMFGFGFIAIPIGIYIAGLGFRWWGVSKIIEPLNPVIRDETSQLLIKIDYCIKTQLKDLEIIETEVITTKKSILLNT